MTRKDDAGDGAGPVEPENGQPASPEDEFEGTRKLILERRNRFMAAALAGIGMAGAQACTCLSVNPPSRAVDAGGTSGGGRDGGGGGTAGTRPNVCLSGGSSAVDLCPDRRPPPCVCLDAPLDASVEDDGGADAG